MELIIFVVIALALDVLSIIIEEKYISKVGCRMNCKNCYYQECPIRRKAE